MLSKRSSPAELSTSSLQAPGLNPEEYSLRRTGGY